MAKFANDTIGQKVLINDPWVDVRCYSSLSAAITAIGSTPATLLIPNGNALAASLVIPSNIHLYFLAGGSITTTGWSLTINGAIQSGLFQIFVGTGTVSYNSAMTPEVYPQWWGAAGDGATDDTAALQRAMTAAGGKAIRLTANKFLISSQITIPQGTLVIGSGIDGENAVHPSTIGGTILLSAQSSAFNFFTLSTGAVLKDLTFDSTSAITPSAGDVILIPNGASYIRLINIVILNAFNGITSTASTSQGTGIVHMEQVTIKYYQGTGITLQNQIADVLEDITLYTPNTTTAIGLAIKDGSNTIQITNLTVIGGKNGIVFSNSNAYGGNINNSPFDVRFVNFGVDGTSAGNDGIVVLKSASISFINGWIGTNGGNGITIGQSQGVSVRGCTIMNNVANGIEVQSNAKFVNIKDNIIMKNGTDGIHVDANTNDFTIQSNASSNSSDYTANMIHNQAWGINIVAGTSDRYIVADNLVSGNATGGVSDGGSGANKRVANNY